MSKRDDERGGWGGASTAWAITATLLAGMLAWGLIGWAVDSLTESTVFRPLGVLVGLGGALYLIVRRYGGLS